MTDEFKAYQVSLRKSTLHISSYNFFFGSEKAQVLRNATQLGTSLQALGYELVSGGTDTHLQLVNVLRR